MKAINKYNLEKLVPEKYKKNFRLLKDFELINWVEIDFLGWIHPSGHLGYLLEDLSGYHKLWIFTCNPKKSDHKKAQACPICLSIHTGDNIGVKIFSRQHNTKKNVTIGQYFCGDLNCNYWVRKIKSNTMREDLTIGEKRLRMLKNLKEKLKSFD